MIDIFTSDKLKVLYPKVESFVNNELYPIEMELLKQPFNDAEKILQQKRELAKRMVSGFPICTRNKEDQGFPCLSLPRSAKY